MYEGAVQDLIDELGRLPGVGPKSAQRIAFHLLQADPADVERLTHALSEVKARVRFCEVCFNVAEGERCRICADPRRDDTSICVVEEPKDVVAIERTREFRGRYHVLGGAISPIDGVGPEDLRVRELLARLGDGTVTEVIIATDPNLEGEATASYLSRMLRDIGVQRVTRLASGLPVGGDLEAGEGFLRELVPFVYRKYLDYAAIADIHSIKRQIHAHKGFGAIAVKGHNVKLGRGGIREIEFFAQTQQLIAGGRMPQLRVRATEEALQALTDASWIDETTRAELTECYWFLRDIEHRIQMVYDEQTHVLPQTEAELRRIALMAGFPDTASFSSRLESVLKTVERRYAKLFEHEGELSGAHGNLVFTGQRDDPDTLKTLRALGFERPEDISRVIRTWHYGRYRATQSAEARERLTELMPELLK
ncbi:MAG: recombination protein RecR, partial [Micrococcales bacterium]|nr:recombination protein RecR [Micrococcales bacterium]